MRTRKSYLIGDQRRAAKFAKARIRKAELRLTAPPPDYPPIIVAGTLLRSITLRDHRSGRVTVIELRQPARARSDQFAVTVNGAPWPKHGRPVGISAVREAVVA